MCGRITRTSPRGVIASELGVQHFADGDLPPRYNIAPSQNVDVLAWSAGELRVGPMKWGFASRSGGPAPINARCETVASSRLFAESFARRRCIVIADGFYEWRRDGRSKRPYYIRLRSRRPFGLAGVWTLDRSAAEARRPTCAILTCPPNALMEPIHSRMPVIVPSESVHAWLSRSATPADLRPLLAPLPADLLEAYEVSTYVNSPQHDSEECIRPVGPALANP
jgi:putative SOS response-associated peptidase YedK